ncbi:hypothetical protein QM012_003379 [Aureobasidium pullulans]|uniref:Uncharacterized protein n=1 Tax=Aureobasidium pullulans TaxID=5580 RepID=A0ABR0T8S8_AURPU
MAPMSYAAAAKKAANVSGGTTDAVSAGISKPNSSPTRSSTKRSSPGPKNIVPDPKRSRTAPRMSSTVTTDLSSETRHSLRLEGKPPEINPFSGKIKYENRNFQITRGCDKTREGAQVHKRFRKDEKTGHHELIAYRAGRGPEHFYPGMIIRATGANYQTNLKVSVDERDDRIRKDLDIMVHKDGPIFSKKRPMIVLWKTLMGLLCLPMTSHSSVDMIEDSKRWEQLVSATKVGDESWPGKTPWAGKPLIFETYEIAGGQPLHEKCFVNLATPVHVSVHEEINVKMGRLSGDQYCRLLNAFIFRQKKLLQAAFGEYGQDQGVTHLLKAWESRKSGDMLWPAEMSAEWKQMEDSMSAKLPKTIDSTGRYVLI